MDLDATLRQVEDAQVTLTKIPTLSIPQSKNLDTIIDLIKEDPVQLSKRSQSTRSRRKVAHALLATIYGPRRNKVTLFLCSITFSIHKLNEINQHAHKFIPKLESRMATVELAQGIVNLAEAHLTQSLLSRLAPDATHTYLSSGETKRLRIDPTMHEHAAFPAYHGVLDLTATGEPAKHPTDDYTGNNSDDSEGSERSLESDAEAAQGVDRSRSPHKDEESDYAAYKLKPMDVIRVLASQEGDVQYRLTMPHLPTATPFITIPCPHTIAMQFLKKRKQLRW